MMVIIVLLIVIALLAGIAFSLNTSLQRMERTCSMVDGQPIMCPPCVCPQVESRDSPPVILRDSPPVILRDSPPVILRDRAVNNDPLYPPLNRGPLPGAMHGDEGTFRLVGYLISSDANGQKESWKLFGREKDRHRSEFYVTSTDKTMDLKVFLTDEIVSPRLRDMYSLPDTVTINHPMFNAQTYKIVENPRSDLSSAIYA